MSRIPVQLQPQRQGKHNLEGNSPSGAQGLPSPGNAVPRKEAFPSLKHFEGPEGWGYPAMPSITLQVGCFQCAGHLPSLNGKGEVFCTWQDLIPGAWKGGSLFRSLKETVQSHPWLFAACFHLNLPPQQGSSLADSSLKENSLCYMRFKHILGSP